MYLQQHQVVIRINGLNYTAITSDIATFETCNNNVASINNGTVTMKKSGTINIYSMSKAHGKDKASYAKLLKNTEQIYSVEANNEIIRKDTIEVNVGDTINFQIASGNYYAAGMITIIMEQNKEIIKFVITKTV